MYFDCPLYFQYIKENGLCFSQKKREKTKILYLKDCENLDYKQLDSAIAFQVFASIFGFNPDKVYEEAQRIKYPDEYEKADYSQV